MELAIAILVVIALNAAFAFAQERHAERAVEALQAFLPPHARVVRDGREQDVDAATLVPGDLLVVQEGDRICADARLLEGAVEVDLSALNGESVPVLRAADLDDGHVAPLDARDLVFSGTSCTGGDAHGIVMATGMATQLGRIAALSQRSGRRRQPAADRGPPRREAHRPHRCRRRSWRSSRSARSPGCRSPTRSSSRSACSSRTSRRAAADDHARAGGRRPRLARGGALVKRLSAVETLGATDVICTDKTGTLTENRMEVDRAWAGGAELVARGGRLEGDVTRPLAALGVAFAACNTATLDPEPSGDPTEIGLLRAARDLGADISPDLRRERRVAHFRFDPRRKLMTTLDRSDDGQVLHVKGAPDVLLERAAPRSATTAESVRSASASAHPSPRWPRATRRRACACSPRADAPGTAPAPADRDVAERDLCLLGFVAMLDPPRATVADAVARCHQAGIRILVVSGDHGLTVAAVARRVGIGGDDPRVVTGSELDAMPDAALDELLATSDEIVFARTSPEAKLRIADALKASGHVVAMTGDGVNDAPALRRADIGVAMGASGTDVAREAATMVLTDDDFATIVTAVEEGRRVYANIRKFILYIFAHAPAEVVPFLLFALSGGAIPLPLTVMQILAIDLGTETLPALALGREPAEPGTMDPAAARTR